MTAEFPPRLANSFYLTEAGTETEILYKWGFEMPEFAMFPLLDNAEADRVIRDMYRRYFDVAAEFGTGMLVAGHDYRASPDWAAKLGYSVAQLADVQTRVIAFLQEICAEYTGSVPHAYTCGAVGPRGDAYGTGGTITADEAEEYHAVQMANLRASGADMAVSVTFNNIPEAIGAIRAARGAGLPVGMSLTLTTEGRLRSGPSLKEAVETIDAETGGAAAWFGTNCAHPLEFDDAIGEAGNWRARLRYVRPNAVKMEKVALCKLGHLEDGDPQELGQQMAEVARSLPAADIIGGCCGTDERHLREIARNLAQPVPV